MLEFKTPLIDYFHSQRQECGHHLLFNKLGKKKNPPRQCLDFVLDLSICDNTTKVMATLNHTCQKFQSVEVHGFPPSGNI